MRISHLLESVHSEHVAVEVQPVSHLVNRGYGLPRHRCWSPRRSTAGHRMPVTCNASGTVCSGRRGGTLPATFLHPSMTFPRRGKNYACVSLSSDGIGRRQGPSRATTCIVCRSQSSRRSSCHPCRTLTLLWPDAGAVVGSSKLRALSVMMASMSRVEAIRIGRWETRVGRSAIGSAARRRCRGPDHVTRRCTHRYSTASRLGGTADVVERTRLSEVRAEPMPKRPGPSWRSRPEDLRGLSTPPPDSVRIASGLPWHPMEGYPLT